MKMAKPSSADITAAGELLRLLDLIDQRFICQTDDAQELDAILEEEGEFDAGTQSHLQALHASLIKLLREAPGFHLRVIGGMCHVICWDQNKILDTSASVLQLHPDLLEGLKLLNAQRKAHAPKNEIEEPPPMGFAALRQAVEADPSVSYALKRRLEEDMRRDPLDALNDAELLQTLMERRLKDLPGMRA